MLSRKGGRMLRYGNVKHGSWFGMQTSEGWGTGGQSRDVRGLVKHVLEHGFYHEVYGGC